MNVPLGKKYHFLKQAKIAVLLDISNIPFITYFQMPNSLNSKPPWQFQTHYTQSMRRHRKLQLLVFETWANVLNSKHCCTQNIRELFVCTTASYSVITKIDCDDTKWEFLKILEWNKRVFSDIRLYIRNADLIFQRRMLVNIQFMLIWNGLLRL